MEADSGIVLTLYFSCLFDGFLIDTIFLLRMVTSPELDPSCENDPQNGSLKKSLRAKMPFSKPVALKNGRARGWNVRASASLLGVK